MTFVCRAAQLTHREEADLNILHVMPRRAKPGYIIAAEDRMRSYESRELSGCVAAGAISTAICFGRPADLAEGAVVTVLSRALRGLAPDLLVIGNHGRTRISGKFCGSFADAVLATLTIDTVIAAPRRW